MLREHFGDLQKVDLERDGQAGDTAGGTVGGWSLTACGQRVLLRGGCLPFERVESDSPEAADRVSQVLRRAQRASLPLLLD